MTAAWLCTARWKRRGPTRRAAVLGAALCLLTVIWLHGGEDEALATVSESQALHQDTEDHQVPPVSSEKKQDDEPRSLPQHVLDSLNSNPKGAVKQTQTKESAILDRMEKSMAKLAVFEDKERELLPKPKDILREAVGPVRKVSANPGSATPTVKLLVVARESTGYPVLGQFFSSENDFFQHGEPPQEVPVVSNLLNCVLTPELVAAFPEQMKTSFGESPYFLADCLLDSKAVCSDPLSYEIRCSEMAHQVIRSRHFPLSLVKNLLEDNEDLRAIFLVRDPRGVLARREGRPRKPDSVCEEILSDLDQAGALVSSHPGQFALTTYEVLATRPTQELRRLLDSLDIDLGLSERGMEGEGEWSREENSVQRANSWKQRLSSQDLQRIESQCLETLSRLEYQLLGQGVAG